MATDPAAARARLEDLVTGVAPYTLGDYRTDLRALLIAYDRQAPVITAAVAYRAWFIAYDGLEGNLVEGHRLLTELRQATAALAGPAVVQEGSKA